MSCKKASCDAAQFVNSILHPCVREPSEGDPMNNIFYIIGVVVVVLFIVGVLQFR